MKQFTTLLLVLLSFGVSAQQYIVRPAPKSGKVITEYKSLNLFLVEGDFNPRDFEIFEEDKPMTYSQDAIPNDPFTPMAWHLPTIHAYEAWDLLPDASPVTVAIFDGGVDMNHSDLAANIVSPFDAVTNQPSDGSLVHPSWDSHGTKCAGVIAAVTGNGVGVSGVGNNLVKVKPINIKSQIFNSSGQFMTSTVIQLNAIEAAVNSGCKAISMSYTGTAYSSVINAAFEAAKSQGVSLCASTGNYNDTIIRYPAAYASVYGIGGSNENGQKASFATYGDVCDLSAPAVSIYTTNVSGYVITSGTSFSCPLVAGCAALLSFAGVTDPMERLIETAEKTGGYIYENGRCNELGAGVVNLLAALSDVVPEPPVIDPATISVQWQYESIQATGNNVMLTAKFRNLSDIPITHFTYRMWWETCEDVPSYAICSYENQSYPFMGLPLPPLTTNTYSNAITPCIANCGLSKAPYNIVPAGGSNTIHIEVLTVNGEAVSVTDSCVVYRSSPGAPVIEVYTISGVRVAGDLEAQPSGLYIVREIYQDRIVTKKIGK